MKQCMNSENLHRRLKKIIGQVQAIDRMIDEDVPCEDVLAQLNAAKSALHKVGQVVLEGHISHCVRDGLEHGDPEETIARFTRRLSGLQHDLNGTGLMPFLEVRRGGLIFFLKNLYPYRYIKCPYPYGYEKKNHHMLDRLEKLLEWGGTRRKVALLSVSGLALLMSMLGMEPLPFEVSWIAIVLCGVPIVLEAVLGLATAWDIKADVLVSVALVASVIIGEDFAAAEIAFIMQLGELLEELTVARARKGIERLVRLTPATARKVEGTREEVIPAEEVRIGDILRVLPGETVPADGVILSGHTSVNQSVMTGEPLPIDKEAGDEVSSGTVNQFGTFDMKAARTGKDSSIQRMVRLVQSADAGKAKIVRLADRWATWIVAIALVSAGGAWIATGELIRAVTILVVFCPCALVLATPTAVMAAIGNATRHGFLVREGDALERLSCVSHLTFDKTGTLTCGAPRVAAVRSFLPELPEQELYRYAACAELRSEHPLGKAIVRCYRKDSVRELPQPEQFRMIPGRGVRAVAQGKELLAGNLELVQGKRGGAVR